MKVKVYKDKVVVEEITREDSEKIARMKSLNSCYYSPSFIGSWNGCPARCFVGKFIPETRQKALIVGSAVHKLLETDRDKLDIYTLDEIAESNCMTEEEINSVKNYYDAHLKIVDDWGDYESLNELDVTGAPTVYSIELPNLKGFIDRVDEDGKRVRILDYKTGSKPPVLDNYKTQMTVYKWLYEKMSGKKVTDLCIESLYVKDPKLHYIDITASDELLVASNIKKVDEEVKKARKSLEFERDWNWTCRFCQFKDHCVPGNKVEL